MKRLIELANRIKDRKLREKTLKMLKEPGISDPEIIYPRADLKAAPSWVAGAHHSYDGGLADHTVSVTNLSIMMAENFEKLYKAKINFDHLIAGALLHDIMKLFLLKKVGKDWTLTGSILDHADFTACELYASGFPEEVVHIAAAHGGELGASAASPRTIEAMIVYYADILDSAVESQVHGIPQLPLQLLLMGMPEEKSE